MKTEGNEILTLFEKITKSANVLGDPILGEVAEWLNAPLSKSGRPVRVSGVRISPSPPKFEFRILAEFVIEINAIIHKATKIPNSERNELRSVKL